MKRILILALLLSSCGAPEIRIPEFGFPVPEAWTASETPDGRSPADWWMHFKLDDLNDLVTEALRNNYDLKVAAARIDAAAAQARIAGADLYPRVGVGGSGQKNVQNLIGFPIPGATGVIKSRSTRYDLSANVSWELDLWGRARNGEAAAIADLQATQADFIGAKLSLIAQTCRAYFLASESRAQMDLSERTLKSFRESLERISDRFKRGLRPAIDLRLAETNVSSAEATLVLWQRAYDESVRQLEVILGRYPRAALKVRSTLPGVPAAVPAGIPADLLSQRPDLVAAERRLAASNARVSEADARLYPSISLTASGGTTTEKLKDLLDGDFLVWNLVGNLLQPLFEGGRLRAGVDLSKAIADQNMNLFIQTALRAYGEVETALAAERFLSERQAKLQAAVDDVRAAEAIANRRYLGGVGDIITLFELQRNAFTTESQLILVRRIRLEARINLHLALGGGFRRGKE